MKAFWAGAWRFIRVFVSCAVGVVFVLPADKWISKETLAIAIGAGIAGVAKWLRDSYGFDIKVL